ncbi:hypothetical protein OS493_020385 [Desmophyllum pertusum]|uniref:GTP cyclohydrolase 1 feedback regulatory protein n=1 Tax=Desmophyllum pertusum TaxID=174260 RepID=A0A9X0D3X4_9CNID|nr:hypothetical protein OS493_020385 [Desmophyllum pertusum]
MPYILVRNTINPHRPQHIFTGTLTYIECPLDTDTTLTDAIENQLTAKRVDRDTNGRSLNFCSFRVHQPPFVQLNLLETHGFKVVAVNTVRDTCIWTMHKPA